MIGRDGSSITPRVMLTAMPIGYTICLDGESFAHLSIRLSRLPWSSTTVIGFRYSTARPSSSRLPFIRAALLCEGLRNGQPNKRREHFDPRKSLLCGS